MNKNSCDHCACGSTRAAADVPRNAGIDRRAFLAHGATAAVAVALAACGIATDMSTSPGTLSQKLTLTLSAYPALAKVDGVVYVSDSSGNPVAVVRTSSSSFVALSRICPHAGNIIQSVSGGFYCPGHGAQFSYSGQWVGGQPTYSMSSYPAVYDATAGTLTIG
jgi:nitrite reductase/ring-hydroxylating ferredoxin subunit